MALKKSDWLKQYRRDNVGRYLLSLAKARAKRFGIPFNITEDDIVIPKRCPALGIKLENFTSRGPSEASATLDKINPELGYIKGNVQVISCLANRIKNDSCHTDILKVGMWLKSLTARRRRGR